MSRPRRVTSFLLALAAGLAAAACAGCPAPTTQPEGYRTIGRDPRRNTDRAAQLDREGVELLSRDNLPQAEAKFKEALACDMFYGPAHNNLGTVYYKQGKLYPAAWEYQLAASAMPEKAGPVNNQGLVQERAGKLEEAAKLYEKAAKLSGEAMQVNANLARTYIRLGRRDSVTADLLHKVTANDTRPEWVSWAQRELATIGMAADHATTAPASAPATPPAPAPKPTPTTKPAPTTSPLL